MIPTFAGFNLGLSAPAAPIMNHHTSTGQFVITNYNSTLAYTATLVSGSGTASLNTSTGVYTLSATPARFSITAGYAAAAPQSAQAFMDRRPYTFTNVTTCTDNCRAICCNCFNGASCSGCGPCPGANNGCDGDGYCASDGCICCGGSVGQTCTTTSVKNATPAGYTDSFNEWWKVT